MKFFLIKQPIYDFIIAQTFYINLLWFKIYVGQITRFPLAPGSPTTYILITKKQKTEPNKNYHHSFKAHFA